MIEEEKKPHILIVDDVAQNIQILATMLSVDNYRISFAQRGSTALNLVKQDSFDLILLDVQMPEMNGFEVCEAIKAQPLLKSIPIIFLTAYAGSEQSVLGFKLGAVDYITKPVEPMELRARVRTHLALKKAHDQIVTQNKNLQQLNHEKSQLLRFVSHDLKTPLTIMSSGLDYLDTHIPPSERTEKVQRRLLNLRVAIGRMGSIIEHFLNRESIQKGRQNINPKHFSLADFLQELQLHHETAAEEKQMLLKIERKEWRLYTDRIALQQILDNLLSNAIKYAPANTEVTLSVVRQNGACIFCVGDQGDGFDSQWLNNPENTETKKALGLHIVKKMVTLLGGCILIHSNLDTGTKIEVSIPMEVPL